MPRPGPARPRRTTTAPVAPAPPRWRGPVALLLALLVAAGVGVGAWWYGWERWTLTPGVLQMTQAEATDRLEQDGLGAELGDGVYSETVPKGEVVSSEPGPGDRVLDGGTVTLVLSLGKERYEVPRLRGMTEDEAQDALAGTNLAFDKSTGQWSEKVPEGQVISSTPEAGKVVRPGAEVALVISKGRRPIKVPDWTGRDAAKAEEALTGRGLTCRPRRSTPTTSPRAG